MRAASLFPAVKRLLLWQASIVAVAVVIAYLVGGMSTARSALLGGLIAFLPNVYLARRVGVAQNKTAQEIVRSFYIGETVKIIVTALLFGLALHVPGVVFAPLIAAFIAALMVFWLGLLQTSV